MRHKRAITAAVLLGIGMGGFIDGIALHQIAHWHQMLSAVMPPETLDTMKLNMQADGLFHLATWLITLAGVLVLRSAVRGAGPIPSTRGFIGYLLIGGVGLIVLGFVLRDRLPASARVEAERRSGLDRRLNAR